MKHVCDASLMLVQPASHMVVMKADTCAGAGEDSGQLPEASRWSILVAEYADVFEPPGIPVDH